MKSTLPVEHTRPLSVNCSRPEEKKSRSQQRQGVCGLVFTTLGVIINTHTFHKITGQEGYIFVISGGLRRER